jgi:hypothetical protein
MDNVLLKFVVPSLDGNIHSVLQLTFAVLFVTAVVATLRAVSRSANHVQWQRNFADLEQAGAAPAAHSSADELAHAVATPAERWADILPSMLLVFGLLGTFIGLGLALTEAANALGPGADALSRLTPIMDSLGSKFKTSTWGIFAFLSLKVWFTLHPYEERRHAWAATRLRDLAARAAALASQQRDSERRELIEAILSARDDLHQGQQRAAEQASEHHAAHLDALQRQTDRQKKMAEQQLELGSLQLHALKELCAHGATAAAAHAQIAAHLDKVAAQGARTLERVDAVVRHGVDTVERLAEVVEHSSASRIAMETFSHSVQDNIGEMANAAGGMALAAQAASKASTELSSAVGEFRDTMTAVLGDVKAELGTTIGTMGTTFADNMAHMSSDLKGATDGIQYAIGTLAGGVTETITQLQKASEDASVRQEKARATFAASGEALMANMQKMGDFMEQTKLQVDAGLKSVSVANNRMLALDKHFEERVKRTDEMLVAMKSVADSLAGLAGQLQATERNLAAAEPLADNIRMLADTVGRQHACLAESGTVQLKLAEEQARVLGAIGLLNAAVAELLRVKPADAAAARNEREAA